LQIGDFKISEGANTPRRGVATPGSERVDGYTITAVPEAVGKTGDLGFCTDEGGVLKQVPDNRLWVIDLTANPPKLIEIASGFSFLITSSRRVLSQISLSKIAIPFSFKIEARARLRAGS